jgi:DNA recombination protein RmuC
MILHSITTESIALMGLGLVLAALVWLWYKKTLSDHRMGLLTQKNTQLTQQLEHQRILTLQWQQKAEQLQQQLNKDITALKIELAQSNTLLQSERQQAEEKLALIESAKQTLAHQFQSLAAEVLAQTGERLQQQQQFNLAQVIEPFKDKLNEFKGRVEQLHHQETIARTQLSEQVSQLMQASAKVSAEAQALTKAMTGNNKSQGDWGEMVLERLLELAGLSEGQHFTTQHSTENEAGNRQRPDVVLQLPDDKHLIIDSKVSLTAYTRYVNAEDDTQAQQALAEHLQSLRQHITQLGSKNYPAGKNLNSPDFVILFMPIEPALLAAAKSDPNLYTQAWQHNVLLTSPSTLLFVLRMVGQLWRNAQQQQNVQQIITRGERLLDKFNGFNDELEKIGSQLGQAQKSWENAKAKFSGNGGLISQAQKLANLGIKPKKPLPPSQGQISNQTDESD